MSEGVREGGSERVRERLYYITLRQTIVNHKQP